MSGKNLDRYALAYSNRVQVTTDPESSIINVVVESTNQRECADIANAFATSFEKMSSAFAKSAAREATRYIMRQLMEAGKDLDEKERKIFEFTQVSGVVSLPDEIMRLNTTITSFEDQKNENEMERVEADAKVRELGRKLKIDDMRLFDNPKLLVESNFTAGLRGRLVGLQEEKAALLQKYTENHPDIVQLDKGIASAEDQLKQAVTDLRLSRVVVSEKYFDAKQALEEISIARDLASVRVRIFAEIVAKLKEKQKSYPKLQYEFARLTRERDVAEELYTDLYKKSRQAKIDEVQQGVNVHVLDKAAPPAEPFWPDRKKYVLVSCIFGLFLGVGIAFLLEEMEESVGTSDDVKNYLNLPVLGSVPYSAETINKLITDVPLKSPIAEAYRRLSFFTQLFCLDPPIKTLLVTSSKSDEGKTTTLANLAISMAQEGTRVLVVDTDLRRPMLHRLFGIDNSLGLSSILTGELEAEIAVSDLSVSGHLPRESFMEAVVDRLVQPVAVKGLCVLPSGPLPANSIELLRSERMLAFLRIIEKKADIVIFDSPPAIHVIDAVVLAQILDGVLFVINSGRINKDEALQVKYMIESTKTPIIGVALNNIEASSPDYYYYYYYGGYGYGTRNRRKRVKLKR